MDRGSRQSIGYASGFTIGRRKVIPAVVAPLGFAGFAIVRLGAKSK